MSHGAPLIEYAPPGLEAPADRLLRRIVAWSAIVYGAEALVVKTLHVALSRGWLASPSTMSWSLDGGWSRIMMAAQALTMLAMLIGGVLMLRRSRACLVILRAGVACSIVLAILSLAMAMRASPVYRSYWSTPAAAAVNAMDFMGNLWLPILIVLLTLPPLARRMV
jgi:hypothetical protein